VLIEHQSMSLLSRRALSNALSGAAADVFSTSVLFPLDGIKLRMQADSTQSVGDVLEYFRNNPTRVYNGLTTKALQGAQQKFQYFYTYALLKQIYIRYYGNPSTLVDLAIGYVSAFQGLLTTLPLDVTNTQVITQKTRLGFWKTFRQQLETGGVLSFYRTIFASAVLCLNPAITYVIFEKLKAYILSVTKSSSQVLTTTQALVISVIAKSIASIITFPFIRAKVVMNTRNKKDTGGDKKQGLIETVNDIIDREGLGGLYVGLSPQLIKGVTNAALMLTAKERIYGFVQALVIGANSKTT